VQKNSTVNCKYCMM